MKKVNSAWLLTKWLAFIAVLKIDFYQFQAEMAQGLLELPEYADITQTRQSGKSFGLGIIIYFLAYLLKWDIIICAPKLDQTQRIMMVVSKIATYMKRKKKVRHPVHSTRHIQIAERGSIICISGDPYAEVEGHHAHLIVCDEKQNLIKDHIVTKILPFRAFHNGLVWSLGIGGAPGSWGELSRKKADGPGNFLWNCPWQRVVIDKPDYQNFVDDQREIMLPVEFKAHLECEELDMSSHILVPFITPYENIPDARAHIQIGLDFGSINKTVATVRYKINDFYFWDQWFVADGDYSIQIPKLEKWLREDVEYDAILGEYNGVGRPIVDILNRNGFEVAPIDMDSNKKTYAAHRIKLLASKGLLQYNPNRDLSKVAYKNITELPYKMTSCRHVNVDHNDFYSSGILTLLEPPKMRLSA